MKNLSPRAPPKGSGGHRRRVSPRNMNTDEVALAAGSTLMLLRALRRRYSGEDAKEKDTETRFALGAIDYPILVLFIGQFILVGATVDTGLPQRLFRLILGPCAGHLAQSPVCLLWFAGVVLLLSNVISQELGPM